MAKSIIKEIIIMLLLCLAIILVLGVLLYDYVPMSKVVPEEVSYVTPESVAQELQAVGGVDESQVIMTYKVDSTDLNNYKRVQKYKPGKANPFTSWDTGLTNSTAGTTQNANSSGTTSTNNNTTGNNGTNQTNENNTNTSGGRFFQDKGTK